MDLELGNENNIFIHKVNGKPASHEIEIKNV